VIYVNVFPNILLSLHPDYVMTHRLTPLAADRPMS
jgi:Rieske 2Fe-2S family protein